MRDVVKQEFRAHHAGLPPGLIETGSILTIINLIRQWHSVAAIPEAVARRDARDAVLRVVSYRMQQELETYESMVPTDRRLSTQPESIFCGYSSHLANLANDCLHLTSST